MGWSSTNTKEIEPMRSTLRRNFINLCFTKIKRLRSAQSSSSSSSSCPEDHHIIPPLPNFNNDLTASILIKNFNSIFDFTVDSTSDELVSNSDAETPSTPDFTNVFATHRFFFSSPGQSNSIVDSSSPSSSSSSSTSASPVDQPPKPDTLLIGGVAVPTYSPDPYDDFRRSMKEMVEARDIVDGRADWDYLHQLLTCYLSLNTRSTHKYIVSAFADLVVALMAPSAKNSRLEIESEFSAGGGCT
ncbi:hypothetical protein U1Q18_020210 [Sarracenia purpurea var. burkii]